MRRKADQHYGRICRFFDTDKRRCTVYEARPAACRSFPGVRCGYYDFLKFERAAQEDEEFVSTTWNK
jgi:Fe-S-cluster containining protein